MNHLDSFMELPEYPSSAFLELASKLKGTLLYFMSCLTYFNLQVVLLKSTEFFFLPLLLVVAELFIFWLVDLVRISPNPLTV